MRDLAELWDLVKHEPMSAKVGFVLVTLINYVEAMDQPAEEE